MDKSILSSFNIQFFFFKEILETIICFNNYTKMKNNNIQNKYYINYKSRLIKDENYRKDHGN